MQCKGKGWLVLAILFLFSFQSNAQEVIQTVGTIGTIDWKKQVIITTGVGSPKPGTPESAKRTSAIENAKKDAHRNIINVLDNLVVTSKKTFYDMQKETQDLTNRLERATRNLTVTDIRYMSNDEVEVEITMPITGALSDLLLPKEFGEGELRQIGQPLCPCCGQPWPEDKPVPEDIQLIMPGGSITTGEFEPYSGLIVDARALNIHPALAPKVLDEKGNEVYSHRFIKRNYAVQIGAVGYSNDLDSARQAARVKDHPIIVKAKSASGAYQADVVISNSDANLIHGAAADMNFLKRCRVIILID